MLQISAKMIKYVHIMTNIYCNVYLEAQCHQTLSSCELILISNVTLSMGLENTIVYARMSAMLFGSIHQR